MVDEISRQPNDYLRADVQIFLNDAYEVPHHLRGKHEFLIVGTAFMFGQDAPPDSAHQRMAQVQAASLEIVEILGQYAAAVTSDPGIYEPGRGTWWSRWSFLDLA